MSKGEYVWVMFWREAVMLTAAISSGSQVCVGGGGGGWGGRAREPPTW